MLVFVKQSAQVHERLVGNVIIVDAHSFPLPSQEICCIDGPRTAAVNCIKTLPVGIAAASLVGSSKNTITTSSSNEDITLIGGMCRTAGVPWCSKSRCRKPFEV